MKNFTTCCQEPKEHPRDFANRLQLLADQYFETAFANQDQTTKTAAKVLHEGQLLSQYQTGLRDPVGEKVMSRGPKTFADAIDIAVQEMENQKIREQKSEP